MSPKLTEKGFRVEIHSMARGPVVLENVSSLSVLLADGGWLGILPGHAPLVAATEDGILSYTSGTEQKTLEISGGILSIADNVVSILTTR